MEAYEERDIAVVDIPVAFLQTKARNGTMIKLQGAVVEALLKINPKWSKCIVYEEKKRVPTIYIEATKARYGMVDASKVLFNDLTLYLVETLGFTPNTYDVCVVNKQIDGKKCTISWYVDDLKISHKYSNVITNIIKSLNNKYGTILPLLVSRGKVHDYLGMNFDFTIKGKVMITMYDQVDNIIDEAPNVYKTGTGCATASPKNLYSVHEPCEGNELLYDTKREEYHTLTAQCLYISKHGQPDIQTSIAFHCTRVKNTHIR